MVYRFAGAALRGLGNCTGAFRVALLASFACCKLICSFSLCVVLARMVLQPKLLNMSVILLYVRPRHFTCHSTYFAGVIPRSSQTVAILTLQPSRKR